MGYLERQVISEVPSCVRRLTNCYWHSREEAADSRNRAEVDEIGTNLMSLLSINMGSYIDAEVQRVSSSQAAGFTMA